MQVSQKLMSLERSGTFVESTFKIKTSAKAFKILSSGLYSDHIRAILRELGTNAADAHVAAGNKDKPFLVHLPNRLEPWFSIRDYGTGLSDADVNGIYTTYFESNKTGSNDYTGCLGLGSKSPFSYTDSFNVVSYFNGQKTAYSAFINEHGVPSVAKLAEETTSEPNGLEISFPVEGSDCYSFQDRARTVYQYFDVRPEITGATIDYASEAKPEYSQSNWKVYSVSGNNRIIMGNVCYPVNLSNVGINGSHSNIMSYKSIEIRCNIGEVEMTASREALEYTDKTKAVIKKAVEEFSNAWMSLLLDDLAKQPTYWKACVFFREHSMWLKPGVRWNGREVHENINLTHAVDCTEFSYNGYRMRINNHTNMSRIFVRDNPVFVENDLKRGHVSRIKQYAKTMGSRGVNSGRIYYLCFTDAQARQQFMDDCGLVDSDIIKTSTLPKVVSNSIPGVKREKAVHEYTPANTKMNSWTREEFKNVSGGIYIELDGWDVTNSKYVGYNDRLKNIITNLKMAGVNVNHVYGVRKSMLSQVQNNPKWQHIDEVIDNLAKREQKRKTLIMCYDSYIRWENIADFKMPSNDMHKLVKRVQYVKRHRHRLSAIYNLLNQHPDFRNVPQEAVELEAITLKYPLLFNTVRHLSSSYWDKPALVDYVKMVNERVPQNVSVSP